MRRLALVPFAALAGSVPALAQTTATGPDFTTLTTALDVSSITEMIMAVGGVLVLIALTTAGVRKFLRMVRGA